MKKGFLTVVLSVLLSGLAAYIIVKVAEPSQKAAPQGDYSLNGQNVRTVNLSLSDYPDFTYAAENAVEAVVYVKVTIQPQQRQQQQYIDPLFRYFFGDEDFGFGGGGRGRERQGSGSGVIIRSDGYIVTNNHVVDGASTIEVTLNNNKTYEATVIGTDPVTDVALIKIDASGLPSLRFADSDKLRLGEWVLAIGSPLGEELRSTITAGIVSAKGRMMPSNSREFKIESFIQTDAAVNPGNSGGALVNKAGKLVGINTAIISTNMSQSFMGYSFAVPSNIVSKIVSDLIDFGSVKRVKLDITISPITDEIAKELKLSSQLGVYVNEVTKGGTADKAGIKKGDVIVSLGGSDTPSVASLQEKVNSFHPGDTAKAVVIRDGKRQEIDILFQEQAERNGEVAEDGSVAFYGASLAVPSAEKLARLGLKSGVEIVSVGTGKMQDAGAQEGFIIQYVNDQPVSKPQDVIDLAKKSKRAIFIEGVTAGGRSGYFGFGKE